MIRMVTIFYLASTAVYFLFGDGNILWAGFNMVTLLFAMMFYIRGTGKQGRLCNSDKIWTRLAEYVTGARMFYTILCITWPSPLIYTANKVLGLALAALIILHLLRKK